MLSFFNENVRQGWLLNSISQVGLAQKNFFAENDSRGMYIRVSFSLIC